ncbi:MAG TPA: EAL domain-containing protein, partial [Candidatus Binatia bacterium]|nr:EAL domain-containing protein [Candidatus Binatia bacterium]
IDGNVEAFESKKQYRSEIQIDGPDGRLRFLSVVKTPKLDANGEAEYLICCAQDVTEHKKAEAGLRMQTSAINAASDQVVITDLHGRIEFANPAFEQETGYSLDEVIGKNPRFLKSGKQDTAFYTLLWNTILNGKTWHGEVTNTRKDGAEYIAQMTIAPVKNERGVIERFVAISRNITEKKAFEKRMDYLAHHDTLTELPNRLLVGHRLTQSMNRARREHKKLAVLFLDLDGFKLVNDTLGHNTGDLMLKTAAERLKTCCREGDVLARMGGDEFIVVIPEIKRPDDAKRFARRLFSALSKPFVLIGREIFVTASIGISIFPLHGDDVESLVKNADAAMYCAKGQGRNGLYVYDEALNIAASERMTLENNLRKAVERDEFVVYYQPRVEIATGRILGAEALVRWRHPERGLVYPDQFIPVAEDTGLVVPISDRVLRTACMQNKAWQDAGLPPIQIAVNLSARQLQRRDALSVVKIALEQSGLAPQYLELELTESALMHNPEAAAMAFNRMKKIGVHLSIDDFGTGYSSLNYLKSFPVDSLKIDRSFIQDITSDADDAAITRAVIAMAHSLNLSVVAEGVETIEQLEFLYGLGCDHMQGYFVSPAVAPEDFEQLLQDSQSSAQDQIGFAA